METDPRLRCCAAPHDIAELQRPRRGTPRDERDTQHQQRLGCGQIHAQAALGHVCRRHEDRRPVRPEDMLQQRGQTNEKAEEEDDRKDLTHSFSPYLSTA